jgi:cytochrome P450
MHTKLGHNALLSALGGDDTLDEADAVNNGVLLLAAATETTGAAITNLLARVAFEPGLFDLLRAEPSAGPAIITETLRHDPPLHITLRYAAVDIILHGVMIPRGAATQVCLASANRDPSAFAQPHVWDATRERSPSLTFGMGQHHCLGMGLAQLELQSILSCLSNRLESLSLIAPIPPEPTGRTFRRVPQLQLAYRRARDPK